MIAPAPRATTPGRATTDGTGRRRRTAPDHVPHLRLAAHPRPAPGRHAALSGGLE